MKVRKFFAPSSREALKLVREALGADAVVLSNRVVDGGVELVALAEEAFTDFVADDAAPGAAELQAAPLAQWMPAAQPEAQDAHDGMMLAPQVARPPLGGSARGIGEPVLQASLPQAQPLVARDRTVALPGVLAAARIGDDIAGSLAKRQRTASPYDGMQDMDHDDGEGDDVVFTPSLAAAARSVAPQRASAVAAPVATQSPFAAPAARTAASPLSSAASAMIAADRGALAGAAEQPVNAARSMFSRVFSRPSFRERAGVAAPDVPTGVPGLLRAERQDDSSAQPMQAMPLARVEAPVATPLFDRQALTPAVAAERGLGSMSTPILLDTAPVSPAAPVETFVAPVAEIVEAALPEAPEAPEAPVAPVAAAVSAAPEVPAAPAAPSFITPVAEAPVEPLSAAAATSLIAAPVSVEAAPMLVEANAPEAIVMSIQEDLSARAVSAVPAVSAPVVAVPEFSGQPEVRVDAPQSEAMAIEVVAAAPAVAVAVAETAAAAPVARETPETPEFPAAPVKPAAPAAPASFAPAQYAAQTRFKSAPHMQGVGMSFPFMQPKAAAPAPAAASVASVEPVAVSSTDAAAATAAFVPEMPAPQFDATQLPAIDLSAAPLASATPDSAALGQDGDKARAIADQVLNEMRTLCGNLGAQLEAIGSQEKERRDPIRLALTRTMLGCGFSAQLVRLLLAKMPQVANTEAGMAWIKATFERNLPVLDNEDALMEQGGVFALMGPTGVGKTTTTAKLAARAVMRHGADRVALLTTDSYRIGAHEQLRIYGRILGVGVHAVKDAADLSLVLSELRNKHMVLIDTIGMSQRDRAVSEQVSMLCGSHLPVKRLLCLNATSRGDTLNEVVRAYSVNARNMNNGANHGGHDGNPALGQSGLAGCIITKVDESNGIGAALDTVMRHRLPVHYVSNGQKVPEDLRVARRGFLIDHAFNERQSDSPFLHDDDDLAMIFSAQGGLDDGMASQARHALNEVHFG